MLGFLEVILYLAGFCSLLFLTYVTTRYIGRKQVRAMKSKSISVLETVMIGTDKRLHLVKAGNSFLLIATTSKSVVFLTAVDLDESGENALLEEEKEARFDFKTILKNMRAFTGQRKKELKINRKMIFPMAWRKKRNLSPIWVN